MKCVHATGLAVLVALLAAATGINSMRTTTSGTEADKFTSTGRYKTVNDRKLELLAMRGETADDDAGDSPTGNLVLVSHNYTWAENLWFDNSGHMYVSDWNMGIVYRLSTQNGKNATEPGAFPAVKERWAGGDGRYQLVLGQQFVASTNSILFVALLNTSEKGVNSIVNVSASAPDTDKVWVNTSATGNGLAYVPGPVHNLYTPSENHFIPGLGVVLEADTEQAKPTVNIFADGLWSADGAYYYEPENLLYISEVLSGHILVYNLSAVPSATNPGENAGKKALIRSYKAPGIDTLDDFCVVTNPKTGRATLIGAAFLEKSVVMFDASLEATVGNVPPTNYTVLASGLRSPTSVRPGMGPMWSGPGLFYVSEGGPLPNPGSINDRRIWQLTVDW